MKISHPITFALAALVTACVGTNFDKDIAIGNEASTEVAIAYGLAHDTDRVEYLQSVGARLESQLGESPVPFRFHLVDSSEMNAFSLPGGYIYVTRGILAAASSEDELASTLAHEMIHVTRRHGVRKVRRSKPAAVLKIPGKMAGAVLGDGVGGIINSPVNVISGLNLARYSRQIESEADFLGQELMARAGYNPAAMGSFLDKLAAVDTATTGREETDSYFNSHPYTPKRSAAVRAHAATLTSGPSRPVSSDYLRTIDGLTFGDDVSQGLLRGNTYVAPRLNYALTFPPQWETFRSGGGAMATNPAGNAMIAVLPKSTRENPATIGTRFAAAMRERTESAPVHAGPAPGIGFPSYLLTYRDASGPQPSYLHLLWLRAGDTTSMIIGMGEESHRPELRAAAQSTRRLRPSDLAGLSVMAVESAQLRKGESIEAFGRRTGNQWTPAVTAAMNDAEGKIPPYGRRLKYATRRALR